MIGGKINLSKLVSVITTRKGKDGKEIEGIFIPIENNHLFKSKETKNVYLDLIAFELKDPKHDDTHLVKQSLPKDVREAMSEEEKKEQPIIGNLNTKISGGGSGETASEEVGPEDNLPF